MKNYHLIKIIAYLIAVLGFSFILNLSKANAAEISSVVINEFEYDSIQSGTDSSYEWFELYNTTDFPIILSGWSISDASTTDEIPFLTIEAHDYVVIAATTKFIENYDPNGINIIYLNNSIGNGLSNNGDRLILKDEEGKIINQISYGSDISIFNPSIPRVSAGHSIERCPYGQNTNSVSDFIDQDSPTPGQGILPNQAPLAEAGTNQKIILGQTVSFDSSLSFDPDGQIVSYYWDFGDGEDSDEPNPIYLYKEPGQFTATLTVTDNNNMQSSDQVIITVDWPVYSSDILLNEILPNPSGNENSDEYIEVYNRGSSPVDLAFWKISDSSGSYYIINNKDFQSTIISAGGYFVIYRSISGITLNNTDDEEIYLCSPDGQQKDVVSYTESAEEDCSYNRNCSGWSWSTTLTPGSTNIITFFSEDEGSINKSNVKAKSTKKKSSSNSSKKISDILGTKNVEAASFSSSGHHFSDAISDAQLKPKSRWPILAWILIASSLLGLVILKFLLWRKDRYGPSTYE